MERAAYRARYGAAAQSSMVGPLLLVTIGVVTLLMTTHRIDAAGFWRWYGQWWPLVLIGAGVVMALETVMFSSRKLNIRLGGGVILLGLLLAAAGIIASHSNVDWSALQDQLQFGTDVDLAQMFGEKHQASEQILHMLPENATVVILNPRGDVTIASGSDNQMHLTLAKTIYSNSGPQLKRKMRMMEPLITSSASVVTVHMPSNDSEIADMNFQLPADTSVQVRSDHGNVTINGRQAAVSVNANHGDVQLESIRGPVHANLHQGDFSASSIQGELTLGGRMNDATLSKISGLVAMDGDFFGDVHMEKLQGPVHYHSRRTDLQIATLSGEASLDNGDLTVENAAGPVSVTTHAMDVQLHRVTGDVRVRNANGAVEVKADDPIGSMDIANRNGSVQVGVPGNSKFSVAATAVDGEVHTDFKLVTENSNRHSIVSGSIGGGGPLLHITAQKGDIALRKSPGSS